MPPLVALIMNAREDNALQSSLAKIQTYRVANHLLGFHESDAPVQALGLIQADMGLYRLRELKAFVRSEERITETKLFEF